MKKYIILLIILGLLCLAREASSQPPQFRGYKGPKHEQGFRGWNSTGKLLPNGEYYELQHRHSGFEHFGISGDDDTAGELAEEIFSWI